MAPEREGSLEISLPPGGKGPGVLVAHPWWGLNATIRAYGADLAKQGFVVGLVDLFDGMVANTIEGAQALAKTEWPVPAREHLEKGVKGLAKNPAVTSDKVGAVGFSYSGFYLYGLAKKAELPLGGVVVYYATRNVEKAAIPLLVHFADKDNYESAKDMQSVTKQLEAAGAPNAAYTYLGAEHWFAEKDRPEYDDAAATLAFKRTTAFLRKTLA
jgi:carboxymethylenebutenolidase